MVLISLKMAPKATFSLLWKKKKKLSQTQIDKKPTWNIYIYKNPHFNTFIIIIF